MSVHQYCLLQLSYCTSKYTVTLTWLFSCKKAGKPLAMGLATEYLFPSKILTRVSFLQYLVMQNIFKIMFLVKMIANCTAYYGKTFKLEICIGMNEYIMME